VLLKEYEIVASMRLHFLATAKRRPDQFTVSSLKLILKNLPYLFLYALERVLLSEYFIFSIAVLIFCMLFSCRKNANLI